MRAQLTAGTKFYFVPDANGTKSFCPRQMGQNSFVPGTTELFNFLFVVGTKNVAMI